MHDSSRLILYLIKVTTLENDVYNVSPVRYVHKVSLLSSLGRNLHSLIHLNLPGTRTTVRNKTITPLEVHANEEE